MEPKQPLHKTFDNAITALPKEVIVPLSPRSSGLANIFTGNEKNTFYLEYLKNKHPENALSGEISHVLKNINTKINKGNIVDKDSILDTFIHFSKQKNALQRLNRREGDARVAWDLYQGFLMNQKVTLPFASFAKCDLRDLEKGFFGAALHATCPNEISAINIDDLSNFPQEKEVLCCFNTALVKNFTFNNRRPKIEEINKLEALSKRDIADPKTEEEKDFLSRFAIDIIMEIDQEKFKQHQDIYNDMIASDKDSYYESTYDIRETLSRKNITSGSIMSMPKKEENIEK